MKSNHFDDLLNRYNDNKSTIDERDLLENWLDSIDHKTDTSTWDDIRRKRLKNNILKTLFPEDSIWKKYNYAFKVACLLLVFFSIGLYFYLHKSIETKTSDEVAYTKILPGKSNGLLRTTQGEVVVLSDLSYDTIHKFGDIVVKRIAEDEIYIKPSAINSFEIQTISAPKGGNFTVQFDDKTRVTLNAN